MAAKQPFDPSTVNKSNEYRAAIEVLGGPESASNAAVKSHIESLWEGWQWGSNPAAAIGQVRKAMASSGGKSAGRRTKKVARKKAGGRKATRKSAAPAAQTLSANSILAAIEFLLQYPDADNALSKAREIITAVGADTARQMTRLSGNR